MRPRDKIPLTARSKFENYFDSPTIYLFNLKKCPRAKALFGPSPFCGCGAGQWSHWYAPEYVGRGEESVGHKLRVERVPFFAGDERRRGVVFDLQVLADERVSAQRDHGHVHFVPRELHVVPRVMSEISLQTVLAYVQNFLPNVPCQPGTKLNTPKTIKQARNSFGREPIADDTLH